MANALSITDGTTTISLSSSGCLLTRYVPTAPDLDADGNYRPITEAAEFFISDSSAANVQAKIGSIERLLQDAVRAQSGLCAPVYLQFQTGADAAAQRSEILSFRLLLGDDASVNLYQYRMDCRLILTRLHYWEGAEVELQLSTSNQAAATGGRAIVNHDDAGVGHDNWVQIEAAQVAGSLPAGARIQVRNDAGSLRTWRKLYVALNALSDPANFSHILEAEARLSGGTIAANAAASNGSEVTFTLSASSVTIQWSLSPTLLTKAAGRMFRILAAVNGATGTPSGTAQIAVRNGAGTVNLWKGDVVPMLGAPGLLDLGAIPIPPGGYSAAYGELRLTLTVSGTGTWKIDFLQLTPTDGLALASGISSTGGNEYAVLDSIEGRDYLLQSPSSRFPYVVASGQRIYLYPNRVQRLIVLADSTEANVAIGDAFTVQVWVRPRRLTV
jgi:hypothetical protein